MSVAALQLLLRYLTIVFSVLSWGNCLNFLKNTYAFGHVISITMIVLGLVLPKARKEKKETPVDQKSIEQEEPSTEQSTETPVTTAATQRPREQLIRTVSSCESLLLEQIEMTEIDTKSNCDSASAAIVEEKQASEKANKIIH